MEIVGYVVSSRCDVAAKQTARRANMKKSVWLGIVLAGVMGVTAYGGEACCPKDAKAAKDCAVKDAKACAAADAKTCAVKDAKACAACCAKAEAKTCKTCLKEGKCCEACVKKCEAAGPCLCKKDLKDGCNNKAASTEKTP
jgi:hypothetical protein